ncbi:Alpha/Beta hydrolase protein [Aspergillus unguis]
MSNPGIQQFKINIPPQEVDRLQRKLNDTRLPPREIVPGAGTNYGPSYTWAKDLLEEWKTNFEWTTIQSKLNKYPHYLTKIEGINIHFLHARAEAPNAIPLLLVHGWPGSFYEFSRVWGPLSHPENPEDQTFHAGWTLQDSARVFDALMHRLGYEEYMVQGGDWGHFVARELGARYADSCRLVHFNFAPCGVPEPSERMDKEEESAKRADEFMEGHMGYAVEMRTRPHTVGIALHDNPIGILMWAGEKYNEAAYPENQRQKSWSEAILTTASLYFFTGCIMPSMLCYYENVRHENFAEFTKDPKNYVKVPFGYSSFRYDVDFTSRREVEKTGNLVFYREYEDGGHFAALECPQYIIKDLRELASQSWKK